MTFPRVWYAPPMARSDDGTTRKRGPAEKPSAPPAKKAARVKAAAKTTPEAAPPAAARTQKAAAPAKAKTSEPARPKKSAPAKSAARPAAKPPAAKAVPARAAKPAAKVEKVAKPADKAPKAEKARTTQKPAPVEKAAPARAKAPAAARARKPKEPAPAAPASAFQAGVDEEERIEAAKYLPRELPRLFEEERFIFPESYGQSRVRLLVKDPEWLFAHWDVDPQSLARVRQELGERASALSRLTLRVTDPHNGGESRVLLPEGARSWYVRADRAERSYQAQLGLTLPSGEFRSLAESNTVRTPRSGPSPEGAPRRARFDGASFSATLATPPAAQREGLAAPPPTPGPWRPDPATAGYAGTLARPLVGSAEADGGAGVQPGEAPGGASDVYRR